MDEPIRFNDSSHRLSAWLPGLFLLLMVGMAGIGLLALSRLEDRLIDAAGAGLSLAATDVAGTIDRFWFERDADVRRLAPAFDRAGPSPGALTRSIIGIQQASPLPLRIGVTDARGRVMAAMGGDAVGSDYSDEGWFQTMRRGKRSEVRVVTETNASVDGPDRNVVTYMAPITNQGGAFLGAVVMRLDPPALETLVRDAVRAVESRLPFLQGGRSPLGYQVLTRAGSSLLDTDTEQQGRLSPRLRETWSERLSKGGESGYVEEPQGRSRMAVLTGYARTKGFPGVTSLDWAVLLRVDRAVIVAPLRDLAWKLGLTWALVGVPGLGLLLWATGRLGRDHARAQGEHLPATQSEPSLREREEHAQVVVDGALDALVSIDQEGGIIHWNRQAERVFGWSREEAVGRSLTTTVIPPRYRGVQEQALRHFLATGEGALSNQRVEVTACTRGGREFPAELAVWPVRIGERRVFSAFLRDITERKLRDRRLALQYAVTRVLSEARTVPEAGIRVLQTLCEKLEWEIGVFWILDQRAQVLRVVDVCHRGTIKRAEFVRACKTHTVHPGVGLPGRVWKSGEPAWIPDVMRDPDLPRAAAAAQEGLHSAFAFPIRVARTVHGVLEFFDHGIAQPGEELLETVADIGLKVGQFVERKRAEITLRETEEQLQQSQKMEAIGRLAGGVAHDFNNLLTVIGGYTELLLSRMGPNERMRAEIEEIRKAGTRAASLTGQLLAFSRRQVRTPQLVDLNAVVANMEQMLRRLLGEDVIELTTVQAPNLPKIEADPAQLDQVLMNLAVNAGDAMPQGGKLTIETAGVTIPPDPAPAPGSLEPGAYALITVADTGCGMNEETQSHLFEPFFTTKEKGKGTGLGLSTVYGIVRQNKGHITVESQLGQGSTFKIYFPRADETAPRIEQGRSATTTQGAGETILVVEDEPGVRGLVREMLKHRGYSVLEARDGINAQIVSRGHFGPIDLLLTDVVMPQKSGPEAAKDLMTERPGLKVLYMSGYPDHPVFSQGPLDKAKLLLQKPFTPEALVHKVREVLDMPAQEFTRSHLVP